MDNEKYLIRWPGPWLDEELSQEETADVMTLTQKITDAKETGIKAEYKDGDAMTEEWASAFAEFVPYLNSFMHMIYKLAKEGRLPEWVMKDPIGATQSIIDFMMDADTEADQIPGQTEIEGLKPPKREPIEVIINTAQTFSTIRQGTATNALTKIRPMKQNTTIDAITGAATIKQGEMTITFQHFESLDGLKTSTYKLLDAITVAFTESGAKSPVVTIALDEYMSKCGLKDRKEARKQAKTDLETLRIAAITFREKRRGKEAESYYKMNISGGAGMSRDGIITFTFSQDFYNILLGYPVMPYPPQLWTLNSKRNPNSYYLLRKIAEHKNMNAGKKNEDIISVKTLLASAPFIPSYGVVTKSDRHYDTRIIQPFERDMDALTDTLKWEYCHSNNARITDEEAASLEYSLFSKLLVHIQWEQYPDQTARLEKRAAAIEAAKKKRASKKGGNAPQKGG